MTARAYTLARSDPQTPHHREHFGRATQFMTDVLFFDYWTKGTRHFAAVCRELSRRGYSSMLLHVGSTRERRVPLEEVVDGILCRDFRYYGRSLPRAVSTERPRVIMTLNIQTEDRIINRLARAYGCWSVFLMHGLLPDEGDIQDHSAMVDSAFGLKQRLIRVPKYMRLFGQYLDAVRRESWRGLLDTDTYEFFARMAISPGLVTNLIWKHRDAYGDRALTYGEVYRRMFIERYGFPQDRVFVVGNYNLDPVFELVRSVEGAARSRAYIEDLGVPPGRPAVVYMEGGYVVPTYTPAGWSVEVVVGEAKEVAAAARDAGFHLIVKLHPVTDPAPFVEVFRGVTDVTVIQFADLGQLVLGTEATLGMASTTLMAPIACGRPLIIVAFPPHAHELNPYIRHAVGVKVTSRGALVDQLRRVRAGDSFATQARERFVADYMTYTDGQSHDRIVSHIVNLLETPFPGREPTPKAAH